MNKQGNAAAALPVNVSSRLLPRPSRYFCSERLACKDQDTIATYYCDDCSSFQCKLCESLIHGTARAEFHERKELVSPPLEFLCQNTCKFLNFADVTCRQCHKNLCCTCDKQLHQKPKTAHQRVPFTLDLEQTNSYNSILSAFHTCESTPSCPYLSDLEDAMMSLSSQPYISTLPDIACPSKDYGNKYPLEHKDSNLNSSKSFLLVDDNEVLQVGSDTEFIRKLGCGSDVPVKVISIFGNTGEGKSYTLNHTFFGGQEVFKTSPAQQSCTVGVWVAYDPHLKIITVDTEGLLGITANIHQRTRLLLKVLAISDLVIYRTRAERLHNDLFTFLGDASCAYVRHFSQELKAASERWNYKGPLSSLGPAVVIFHETLFTDILRHDEKGAPEDVLKMRFHELGLTIEAFSALEYVGIKTSVPPTSFKSLQASISKHVKNATVRSPRPPGVIYNCLKVLNEKFIGEIDKTVPSTFPDQYFTCHTQCLSCNVRCCRSMNHVRDGVNHSAPNKCKYQHQFNNQIFLCKACYERGDEVVVTPEISETTDSSWLGLAKYAWSGYVLECPNCGVIYRSRQHWYGNADPAKTVVRTEIQHVWPTVCDVNDIDANQIAAQRVIDSVQYITEAVSSLTAKPTKMVSSWVADQIAPTYWKLNSEITHCASCKKPFGILDRKHHCRACGDGFCEECSSHSRPVPERGWGDMPVRVCDRCYADDDVCVMTNKTSTHDIQDVDVPTQEADPTTANAVTARKVGEVLHSTIETVVSAIDYPVEWIKDSARPTYWVPDKNITNCFLCGEEFSIKLPIHHCRACGQGVCDKCSPHRQPVPSKGWEGPVRVCKDCANKPNL